tara:strand:+ start:317 stop:847 length:531 start_codon:yes stop_codon:yes gene_type:complete
MYKRLIIYSTTDGQTKLICERIKSLSQFNNQTKLIGIDKAKNEDLKSYEVIIMGASIRYGKHNTSVIDFVKENREILKMKKSVFFSVNVVARKEDKNSPETNPYVVKFLKLTKWNPEKKAVFAGKIDYPKYSFLDRHIIRLIMFITKGPTDLSKSFEFTDWAKVDDFTKEIDLISI